MTNLPEPNENNDEKVEEVPARRTTIEPIDNVRYGTHDGGYSPAIYRTIEELAAIARVSATNLDYEEYKELQLITEAQESLRLKAFINKAYTESKRMRDETELSFRQIEKVKLEFDKDLFTDWTREHQEEVIPNVRKEYLLSIENEQNSSQSKRSKFSE